MNKFYAIILSAGLLTLGGCAGGDEPGRADAAESRLTVSIADGGFGSDSRAEEVDGGYATAFTKGDECGLYLVRDGRIIYNNMKLTATAGDDGAIAWKPEADLNGGLDGESYFLYYPYRSEMTEISDPSELSDDAAFFGRLIDTWEPTADQSDYADYTASDLMTAKGRLMRSGASTAEISFAMTHRMSLAVVEMPKTVYKFNEAGIPYYVTSSAADFADSPLKPCRMADGSYRCIVKPASGASLCGIYENNGTKEFAITASATQDSYKTYRVDGAPVTEQECTLKAGDYFCKNSDNNWYVIPQEATPDGNVIGVVFYAGQHEEDNQSDYTQPIYVNGPTLGNVFHGYVIALTDAGEYQWGDYGTLAGTINSSSDWNGYCNQQILATNGLEKHPAAQACADYTGESGQESAPAGSSGWFLPSFGQLIYLQSHCKDLNSIILTSIIAAGGNIMDTTTGVWYWSSSEDSENRSLDVSFGGDCSYYHLKVYTHNVRAVLAF